MRAVIGPLVALVFAGCATGAAQQPPPAEAARVVQIELSQLRFDPSTIVVTAGETVTFRIVNKDTVMHELAAGRQAQAEGGFSDDFFKSVALRVSGGSMMEGHVGKSIMVDPGESAEITFTVPDTRGSFEIGCFVPGHYASGMKGTLIVR